jgi:hypothetical protein
LRRITAAKVFVQLCEGGIPMRTLLSAVLVFTVCASFIFAQDAVPPKQSAKEDQAGGNTNGTKIKPGDTVVVIKDGTNLMVENRLIAHLKKGDKLKVNLVKDAWLFGSIILDGSPQPGWIGSDNCRLDETGGPELRELTVLAVADATYRRKYPNWKQRIARITATASTYYEREFSLRLKLVDCQPWQYEATRLGDHNKVFEALITADPSTAEIEIGLIGVVLDAPEAQNMYIHAMSLPFGRHIVISDRDNSEMFAVRQLVHRIAVIFGAFAVADNTSIMHKEMGAEDIKFDDLTRQVILLSRDCNLRQGVKSLKPENARQIQQLYRKNNQFDSPEDDPITRGYRTLDLYNSLIKKT